MSGGVGNTLYKVLGVGSGLIAGKLATSALDKIWARTRGGEPPRNPAVPGTSWGEAVAWAVLSGIALSLARMLATKGVASTWAKATGELPPGVQEVGP